MNDAEIRSRYGAEFFRCLNELDVEGIMRISAHVFPPEWQPSSRTEALASLHLARTQNAFISAKAKKYSQRWLNERGLGSFMPDNRRGH